jgi:hypothetical protein
MGNKPTAAFVLSLIGGILILVLGGVFALVLGAVGVGLGVIPGVGFFGALAAIFGILAVVFGILVIVGAIMINSGEPARVRTGGILVLIFSVISLLAGGGFFIGFILGLVGGILALTWKPPVTAPSPSTAPSM